MKKNIFLLPFLLGANLAFAQIQPTLPPSPTASALAKYVDNPVSHYTGTTDISIPLYEIQLKDLSVPIGLTYNPQDIQVSTVPSNVGLGWSLNVGGVITRAVKNIPDDARQDYCIGTEEFDQSEIGTPLDDFPYCKWGYLYAISDGEPFVQSNNGVEWGYRGTSTYNLDLDGIYANRNSVTPEEAVLENFAYPLWAIPNFNEEFNWSDATARPIGNVQNLFKMYTDLEPDVFYFSFPGYSGKFVFDVENGSPKIKTIPYQDLQFTYQTDATTGRLMSFTVTDGMGVVYIFEDVENTILVEENATGPFPTRRSTYNSAWWLSRINTPKGETLNFSYESESISSLNSTIAPTLLDMFDARQGSVSSLNNNEAISLYINDTKRISSIYNDDILVEFGANHTRQDLVDGSTGMAITSITINAASVASEPDRIRKFELTYDYFLSEENKTLSSFFTANAHNGIKRLRLRSVQEFGKNDTNEIPKYVFDYNYYDYNNDTSKKFPNRYSYNLDLWGYANGANNVTPVPSHHIYPDHYEKGDLRMFSIYGKSSYIGRHLTTAGGDRLPNASYMDIGVLTKITYPTGGSTAYVYEPHKFVMDGEEFIGGGLRINSIIKDDDQGGTITYNYRYTLSTNSNVSSGKIVSLPMYANLPTSRYLTSPIDDQLLTTEEERLQVYSGRYSYSVSDLGRTSGSNVGYTKVIEYLSANGSANFDNGRTEYSFSFPAAFGEQNDVVDDGCTIEKNGICDGMYNTTRVHNFFMYGDDRSQGQLEYYPESSLSHLTPSNPNYDWNRGLLLNKKYYSADNSLIQEEVMEYATYFPNNQTAPTKVYGIKMAEFDVKSSFEGNLGFTRNYAFRVAKYELLTDVAKVLSSKTIIDYEVGTTSSVSKTMDYKYEGADHKNVTEITENTSISDRLITKYKYPFDYPVFNPIHEGEGIYALRQKNISAIPVEVSEYISKAGNEYLKNSSLITYQLMDGIPEPLRQFRIETDDLISDFVPSSLSGPQGFFTKDPRYVEKAHFKNYDSRGNVLEVEDKTSGITTSYLWGYNNTLPIAKVVNAENGQPVIQYGEDIENVFTSYS